MSATITVPKGVELFHLPSPFRLHSGESLHGAALAFERAYSGSAPSYGPGAAPVVVVLGGISAHRRVAGNGGWWPEIAGEGLAIDTSRFQVLSVDWLGAAGNSTAPAEGESFAAIDAADQARALWLLCRELRIDRLHAVIGCSYGGMVAQHLAALAPARIERLVLFATAHRAHPQASAWRRVQRQFVEFGRNAGFARESLALARQLAMTIYRSPVELHERFEGGLHDAELGGWLDARGADFVDRWHAESFLCLNRSIDAHRIDPAQITSPTFVCAFDTDQLVPTTQIRDFALQLPDLRSHREVRSRYGHDAFLKETKAVTAFVEEALR
ncbi:MAG: homoserine O-succinyltransferase [Planctomycetota bacterium]